MKKKGNIDEAILKVALGYQIAEVTEEYAESNGELKLVKRKKTKKDVPPDLKAVQLLLGAGSGAEQYAAYTDEQLEEEKTRLLAALAEQENERISTANKVSKAGNKTGNAAPKKKAAKKTVKKTPKQQAEKN